MLAYMQRSEFLSGVFLSFKTRVGNMDQSDFEENFHF